MVPRQGKCKGFKWEPVWLFKELKDKRIEWFFHSHLGVEPPKVVLLVLCLLQASM